ncbi:MAG: TRAP transporter small permease [Calditrichaeota bacterium]|nr:TRAP transporter small permease [Calditrichota bacterium]
MWRSLLRGLDRFLEMITTVSMALLTLDVTWQVITRFILKHPSDWTEELAVFLMIWVGLLGSAVALHRGAHLGIDYFVGKLSIKKKLYTEVFAYLCVTGFSIGVMLLGGIQMVSITFAHGQVSPALKIPMGIVYLAVPVTGFFLTLYSIGFLIDSFTQLKSKKDKPKAPYINLTPTT